MRSKHNARKPTQRYKSGAVAEGTKLRCTGFHKPAAPAIAAQAQACCVRMLTSCVFRCRQCDGSCMQHSSAQYQSMKCAARSFSYADSSVRRATRRRPQTAGELRSPDQEHVASGAPSGVDYGAVVSSLRATRSHMTASMLDDTCSEAASSDAASYQSDGVVDFEEEVRCYEARSRGNSLREQSARSGVQSLQQSRRKPAGTTACSQGSRSMAKAFEAAARSSEQHGNPNAVRADAHMRPSTAFGRRASIAPDAHMRPAAPVTPRVTASRNQSARAQSAHSQQHSDCTEPTPSHGVTQSRRKRATETATTPAVRTADASEALLARVRPPLACCACATGCKLVFKRR